MKQKLKKWDAYALNFSTPPLDFPYYNIGSNHFKADITNRLAYPKRQN